VFPNEQIEVSTSGPAIVLRGEVSNETVYDRVLGIVVTYIPPKPPAAVAPSTTTTVSLTPTQNRIPTSGSGFAGGGQIAFDDTADLSSVYRFPDKAKIEGVVDMLVIKEIRQIELDVIVAEVSITKAREVGFNFTYSGPTQVTTANSNLLGPISSFLGLPNGGFTYVNGAFTLVSLYRLLQNKDIAEILAQPRLVIKNGRSGGFLSGGEFPVATSVGALGGTFTNQIEFKPFGVRLDFVPTITWSDRIDIRVFPEVSEPQFGQTVNGIPSLTVRRSVSRVEMKEGESLIIGGLLDRRIGKDLNKLPILGDVPILGALFRSTKFRNSETELIFVITPRIVRTMKPGEKPQLPSIEKYDDPDIRQVPVPGGFDERKAAPKGATIP
jgi:pilus assembly protein CpaC